MKRKWFMTFMALSVLTFLFGCEMPSSSLEDTSSEPSLKEQMEQILAEKGETEVPTVEDIVIEEPEKETVEDLLEEHQYDINKIREDILEDGYYDDFQISAEGNKWVLEYYPKESWEMTDAMTEYLDKMKYRTFYELRKILDLEDLYELEYIYYNPDGTVFYQTVLQEDEYTQYTPYEATLQFYFEHLYGPQYWNNNEEELLEKNKDTFNDIKVYCSGNYVCYTFYFANDMGDIQKNLEYNMDEKERNNIIYELKTQANITNKISVSYIYYNPDGSLAGRMDFEG